MQCRQGGRQTAAGCVSELQRWGQPECGSTQCRSAHWQQGGRCVNGNRLVPLAIALLVLPLAPDARAHNVEECRWMFGWRVFCMGWWFETTCWRVPVRERYCRSIDHIHNHSEFKQERDERILAEMAACIAAKVHEHMDGCDTSAIPSFFIDN